MRISQSIFAKLIYLTVSLGVTGIAYSQTVDRDDRFPNLVEQRAAKQWITDSAFKADIKFLADDLLEGRGPGTRGDELAQRYIISQFEQIGLQPGSADGSWVQKVPLVGVTTKPPKSITFEHVNQELKLENYEDY